MKLSASEKKALEAAFRQMELLKIPRPWNIQVFFEENIVLDLGDNQ